MSLVRAPRAHPRARLAQPLARRSLAGAAPGRSEPHGQRLDPWQRLRLLREGATAEQVLNRAHALTEEAREDAIAGRIAEDERRRRAGEIEDARQACLLELSFARAREDQGGSRQRAEDARGLTLEEMIRLEEERSRPRAGGRADLRGKGPRESIREIGRSLVEDRQVLSGLGHLSASVGAWGMRNVHVWDSMIGHLKRAHFEISAAFIKAPMDLGWISRRRGYLYLVEALPEGVQEALLEGRHLEAGRLLAEYTGSVGASGPQRRTMVESAAGLLEEADRGAGLPPEERAERARQLREAAQARETWWARLRDWVLDWPVLRQIHWLWASSVFTKILIAASSWGLLERLWSAIWGYGLIGASWAWARAR